MESVVLQLLFGFAYATPSVLMAWHWRKRSGLRWVWISALLLCAVGTMGNPLQLALQRVDGVILQRNCIN